MSVMDTMLMLAEPEIGAMAERVNEFPTPEAALISAIGLNPEARNELDYTMERAWSARWTPPTKAIPEVVIGSGPHALIYAAVRASKGIKVVVLERNRRAGGAFGCSQGPAFWLNSRNRPGPLGLPGEGLGLNVLPGCMVQPSMIGGGEYMTNDQLGWTIRVNLMMLGIEVHTGVEVTDITLDSPITGEEFVLDTRTRTPDSGGILTRTGQVRARRVVVATGLGDPRLFQNPNYTVRSNQHLSFPEFMAKMDEPFPLRGMNRVAVIGAGDSGKTVVEALLGIGPSSGMSVAALDFPQQIDWYGCPVTNNEDWCARTQGRYARIGKALGNRITVRPKAVFYPTPGYESVQMGPRSYDWVVSCIGSTPSSTGRLTQSFDFADENLGTGRRMARTGTLDDSPVRLHLIGPASGLEFTERDTQAVPELTRVAGNRVSMFRYAPLTAAFATLLPPVGVAA